MWMWGIKATFSLKTGEREFGIRSKLPFAENPDVPRRKNLALLPAIQSLKGLLRWIRMTWTKTLWQERAIWSWNRMALRKGSTLTRSLHLDRDVFERRLYEKHCKLRLSHSRPSCFGGQWLDLKMLTKGVATMAPNIRYPCDLWQTYSYKSNWATRNKH